MGEALYVDGCYFDHSCAPSIERWTYGRQLEFRAMRRIDTSLEAPLSYYIDIAWPRSVRQRQLRDGWFFECKCTKCESIDDETFDYRLYRTWRETLNHTNVDVDLKIRLIRMHEIVYGEHNQFKTLTMAHLLINQLRNPPKNLTNQKTWMTDVKLLETQLETEFRITHGKDHPMYRTYIIDIRLQLYRQLKTKFGIDLKKLNAN